MMWPMPGSMALSEHLLGLSLVATPLQLAGVNAVAAYNVCLLLTYALSRILRVPARTAAHGVDVRRSVCRAGVWLLAVPRQPARAHSGAFLTMDAARPPGLHAYVWTGARRWLVVFGAAWVIQALSNGYFLLFFPVLVVAWLAWFVGLAQGTRPRCDDRGGLGHRVAASAAGAPGGTVRCTSIWA